MHLWKFHQNPLRSKQVMANLLFLKICVANTAENLLKGAFCQSKESLLILPKSVENWLSYDHFNFLPLKICVSNTKENSWKVAFWHCNVSLKISLKSFEKYRSYDNFNFYSWISVCRTQKKIVKSCVLTLLSKIIYFVKACFKCVKKDCSQCLVQFSNRNELTML